MEMLIVSRFVSEAVTFTGMYDWLYVPFAVVGSVKFMFGVIVSSVKDNILLPLLLSSSQQLTFIV